MMYHVQVGESQEDDWELQDENSLVFLHDLEDKLFFWLGSIILNQLQKNYWNWSTSRFSFILRAASKKSIVKDFKKIKADQIVVTFEGHFTCK